MSGLVSLVLADARFPGGGHVHSGGLEEAVDRGLVSCVGSLEGFLLGRLRTAGLVAASFAAASVTVSANCPPSGGQRSRPPVSWDDVDPARTARTALAELDAELEARTPSAAQRQASRAQGRGTLRAVRAAWPSPLLDDLVAVHPRPHHPLLVGVVCGVAGEPPAEAARCVAYLAVSGAASAAVRLLGLDPFAVNAALVRLGPALETVVAEAVAVADGPPCGLPAPSAPVLDLMAQAHADRHGGRLRLFAS